VARAIAHRPRVLFLDEPTAGLDPQSRIALWRILAELRDREGITVLLTTHYIEEADRLCDRVAIIDHGRILVCDSPAALKRRVGAGTVVELEVAADGLPARLAELPGVRSAEPTRAGVRVLADGQAEGLLPRIVEAAAGHRLRDLSVTETSLETVFIELTGRELRD
jgi:ABC-2 type transport system ATP-binding protein